MNENYNITLLNTESDKLPENLRINVRSKIDHTLLDPAATKDQIITLCEEALEYGFASVCVAPCWIPVCRRKLFHGAETRIATVIGFPHGNESTDSKVFAARDAIMAGADEIDMVINIGWIKQRSTVLLENELRRMVSVCGRHVILKVIIEACLLTDEEKVYISKLCAETGVDYVKTSTGFSTGGAKLEDIKLIRDTVGDRCSIKASGGVRTLEDARAFVAAGCSRIGCSKSVSIAQKEIEEEKRWQDECDIADFWERTERISNYMAEHYERDKAVAMEVKRRREEYDRLLAEKNAGREVDEQELAQILNFNVYELKWEWDKAHGNEPDHTLIPYLKNKE